MYFNNFLDNPYSEIEDPEEEANYNELVMMLAFQRNQCNFNYRHDYFDKLLKKKWKVHTVHRC